MPNKTETPSAAPLFFSIPEGPFALLARLRECGHEAYLVGGCVRDALRGVTPKDYDMTTSARPEEIHEAFAGERMIDTGIAHGTVTVLRDKKPYEITTYRIDGDYRDSRHPDSVCFTSSLREDLARRDFTVNALAYHPDEGVYDYFGGIPDLENHIIRAVGDPIRRFEEDALRILRALRFAAALDFAIDAATADAARRMKEGLLAISAERVREELMKLLSGKAAPRVILAYADILATRLPAWYAAARHDLDRLASLFSYLPDDPVLRLVAFLLPLSGKENADIAKALLDGLRFDHRTRDRALKLLSHIDTPYAGEERLLRRFTAGLGGRDALLLLSLHEAIAARDGDEEKKAAVLAAKAGALHLIEEGLCSSIADLAVGGDDLMTLGYKKGRAVGDTLRRLLDAVLDGAVKNEKKALLHLARAFLP